MIIECNRCESKVDAKPLAEHESIDYANEPFPIRVTLLECPACKGPLVAIQTCFDTPDGESAWTVASRVWPEAEQRPDWAIPSEVASSLQEATLCFKAKAYSACAVMCGRVLEGICKDQGATNKFLAGGLMELLENGVIDRRIFEWGEALREHRNIGAHSSSEKITKQDAQYLVDFAGAICDYVYVLNHKFQEFMKKTSRQLPRT